MEESLEELARLGENIDLAAAEALEAGGDVLLKGMLRRVPVGEAPDDPHPGNLKRHLECTQPQNDGNVIFIDVGLSRKADRDTARYGTANEYGTAKMAAQPYVRPTVDSDMGAARRAMIQVLEEKLKSGS